VDIEADGFAEFVVARERALQRTAWLLTGDWAMAQDLVQASLARAWPRWDRIRRRDNPETYVRKVMINTWATWRRRRWRDERASDTIPDTAAPGDFASELALRTVVRRALGELTDRQRAVVVLRIFDDMSEAEVAQAMNCAVGTVKSTTSQALAKLRKDPLFTDLIEQGAL
jgi:RNA polymerase sigma-70 factor (sigma-E family)